ncbi:hypothetical protein [Lentzea nigeriaca]|uniref:hypothetical protein n=1 Tax=Lentzea nigeriaca TaxID=1128665 RepID=UPI00195BA8B7|nr:hypothetical protein [Lentzea nigeriaca]MBM7860152.1 hypothetical protein [Lentzea nigeriaca]
MPITWPSSDRPDTALRSASGRTGSIVCAPAASQVTVHEPTVPAITPALSTFDAADGAATASAAWLWPSRKAPWLS